MGLKIGENLALLVDHPLLSSGFREVLLGLQRRWQAMSECTAQAAACSGDGEAATGVPTPPREAGTVSWFTAPKRLQ